MSSTQKFNCIFCDDTFDDKETFQVHFRQHGDPNFHHLVKGRKRFIENANVKKADGPDTVSCDVCSETFPTISKAITHKHKVHPDHDAKYFCPWCGKLFTMKHLYNKHITSHSSGDKCEESFHCDCCDVDFYNPAAVMYHNKFFHRQDPDSPAVGHSKKRKMVFNVLMQVYYCAFCGDEYINRVNLQKHMCDDHSDENQSPEEVLRCSLCVAIFYHLDAYEIHLTFHNTEDVYGNSEEENKNELTEFTLETVPPVVEKVENYINAEDHENNINSIGIDQFLQLAIETPVESAEKDGEQIPDQFKHHKKHKKHKKSKKAITLDQFLNMNKDVFGEGLDFQGAVEVPSQVVANQLKIRKPKPRPTSKPAPKVISAANLERLKQQGIVVKMKSANKVAASVPGVKRNAEPNISKVSSLIPKEETSNNAASSIISKIINQPNSQLKIIRKPAMEVNSNETKPSSAQLLGIKTNDDEETKIPSPQSKSITTEKTDPETTPSGSQLKSLKMEKGDTPEPHEEPNDQSNSDMESDNETEQNTETKSNDNYHSLHTNSTSEVKQPYTSIKNLSQEITIKPVNKVDNSDKVIVKPTEEKVERGCEIDDDVIHIDNDDEELSKDNINDSPNIKEVDSSTSYTQKSPTTNTCMELVPFNKNDHNDSDEDDISESESTSNVKNVEQNATFHKIRNFNQNVSIKSINTSQKVTMKSANSSKGGNIAQMSQKIQIQKFQQTSIEQPSHSKQRLNVKNKIQHYTQSPKPKAADSLKVINSFKQITFNSSDDDEFCNDGDSDEINSTEKINECNTVNSLKKFNQQITVKTLNKTAPIQRRHIDKDPITSSLVENFSDNSNTDNDVDLDNEYVPIEPEELNANQIAMNKLKNSNITVKGMNDMKNKILERCSEFSKQEVRNFLKQPLIHEQNLKDVNSDDENDAFENDDFEEEMPNAHDNSSDEEILTPVRDLHQETVNKLLHSNQSLSIKPLNQSNNSKAIMMRPLNAQHADNNLKMTNKNISTKSVGGNKNTAQDSVTNNQRKMNIESPDTSHNQSRDTVTRSPRPMVNSKPIAQVRNVAKPVAQSKICNREVANAKQAQTVKQEVTVKTMQTKTETVVEEVTTTVTKTIRTINQSQTLKQETSTSASGSQIKEIVEASNIQGRNIQNNIRPPIKQIQNVNQGMKVRPTMNPQQRMVRPLPNNPLRVSSSAIAIRPNVHQPRPKIQAAPVMQKHSPPTTQQQKPFIAKPLKVAQNVARPDRQRVFNRMPELDSSGPFSCFKKPIQSLIPFNDMADTAANQTQSMTSHMSKSQQIMTTKSVKGGSVVTSSHQKSEVNTSLSQQLTKLSNTSGLKIVKTSTSSSSEVERCEVSAQKRTALDAIEKLQKQGLLVKKPRMDLDDDMPGSDDEFAYDSEDHT